MFKKVKNIPVPINPENDISIAWTNYLDYSNGNLTKKWFNGTIRAIWLETEFPSLYIDHWEEIFNQIDKDYFMTKSENKSYQELSDNLIVYRGISIPYVENFEYLNILENFHNLDNAKYCGLSWTTNYDKAVMFAKRSPGSYENDSAQKISLVITADIEKGNIFAYLDGQKDSELIINREYVSPKKIKLIKE